MVRPYTAADRQAKCRISVVRRPVDKVHKRRPHRRPRASRSVTGYATPVERLLGRLVLGRKLKSREFFRQSDGVVVRICIGRAATGQGTQYPPQRPRVTPTGGSDGADQNLNALRETCHP